MNTSYDPLYLFIGGEWISAEGRATAAVVNPATAREIGRVPLATAGDLDHALEVTQQSFEQWRQTVPDKNSQTRCRSHPGTGPTHRRANDAGRRQTACGKPG